MKEKNLNKARINHFDSMKRNYKYFLHNFCVPQLREMDYLISNFKDFRNEIVWNSRLSFVSLINN